MNIYENIITIDNQQLTSLAQDLNFIRRRRSKKDNPERQLFISETASTGKTEIVTIKK